MKKMRKKKQARMDKRLDKKLEGMSKSHLKKALATKKLDTKGDKEQLILRIKDSGIDINKAIDAVELGEIAAEEKAKAAAQQDSSGPGLEKHRSCGQQRSSKTPRVTARFSQIRRP